MGVEIDNAIDARYGSGEHATRRLPNANRRRGVAALEFALTFPIVLLLVFFLIEASRAMMVISLLNNAARAGCRHAILPTATSASVQNVVDDVLVRQGVRGHTTTLLINNQPANANTAAKNDLVTVHVRVPMSKVSWIPAAGFFSGTLQGQYTLPRE